MTLDVKGLSLEAEFQPLSGADLILCQENEALAFYKENKRFQINFKTT